MNIVFSAAGAEGLGNIPIDEQFGRGGLENGYQITDTVIPMAGSHKASPVSEGSLFGILLAEDAAY